MADGLSHPFFSNLLPCVLTVQALSLIEPCCRVRILYCFSGLTFTLGTSVPLSLVLELEDLDLTSFWQYQVSSLTSIKSLNALSPNFLVCEMRITISACSCLQNWCLFLKSTFIHSINIYWEFPTCKAWGQGMDDRTSALQKLFVRCWMDQGRWYAHLKK